MEKQRLLKMGVVEQGLMVKALDYPQENIQPEQAEKLQMLLDRTRQAPKGKLYLNDEEFDCAVQAISSIRNDYLSAGKSSGGFDRVLLKLLNSKYRRAPAR